MSRQSGEPSPSPSFLSLSTSHTCVDPSQEVFLLRSRVLLHVHHALPGGELLQLNFHVLLDSLENA